MAVEIKELIIRAVVDYDKTGPTAGTDSGSAAFVTDEQQLVQTCVKQVLKILEQKAQR